VLVEVNAGVRRSARIRASAATRRPSIQDATIDKVRQYPVSEVQSKLATILGVVTPRVRYQYILSLQINAREPCRLLRARKPGSRPFREHEVTIKVPRTDRV
jgi:hypothetical protein